MFKNYSLVALRSIARNKLFSAINIIGLSISMMVGLLAISFISELYSYDTFHEKKDRIYRVINTLHEEGEDPAYYASTSPLTGQRLSENYSGYEKVVTIYRGFSADVKRDDQKIPIAGFYASEAFFDVFTFTMLSGDHKRTLTDPYTIVLTRASAEKIFGKTDVVGEIIELNDNIQLTVTGVVENPPRTSHMSFEAIVSFETLKKVQDPKRIMRWSNMWNSHVYVLLPQGTHPEDLQANLEEIATQENSSFGTSSVEMEFQSLNSIFPGKKLYNQLGARMEIKNVNYMIILAVIVLASAAFNYTNLSVARALKRSKEVGIRKVVGARKGQVFLQFILEAIIISTVALVFAYFLFQLIRPEFLSLNRDIQRTTTLELSFIHYIYFFVFSVVIGIISGLLPSAVLSRLKPSTILRGSTQLKVTSGFTLRKLLIGLQFTLSMAFVILVSLAYKQYQFNLNFDLGFETADILNVRVQGNDSELLTNSFSQVPGVSSVSKSSWIPSVGSFWTTRGKYIEGDNSTTVHLLNVDANYLDNLGHQVLAGRSFTEGMTVPQVVVNQKLLKHFEMGEPVDAIGKHIRLEGKDRAIIGVVKDFQHATLDNEIFPFAFLNEPDNYQLINLKIESADNINTMQQIEEKWSELDPSHEFQAFFYKDRIERAYSKLSTSLQTLGLLAIIAVSISILGLLGMAVYTTESRIKELTIRKVLGASVQNLITLLSKNFLLMFVIASGITIPVTIYAFENWIVPNLVHRIDIGFWEIGSGLLAILVLATLTIGSQTLKAVKRNPVEHLRNE